MREQALTVRCPGSKSMTQRALIIAALSETPVVVEGALDCDDSRYLSALLERLGTELRWEESTVYVDPRPLRGDGEALMCGNAGTTLRFGSCLSLVSEGELVLDGDARMRERPIGPLVEALRRLKVEGRFLAREGYPPIALQRGAEVATSVAIDASLSSQYTSGLLMVAPRLSQGLEIQLTGQAVSMPYVQMTTQMMQRAGAEIRWPEPDRIRVAPHPYRGDRIAVEPDWSTAAFLLAAGELSGCRVEIPDLPSASSSLQGDAVFVDYLAQLQQPHQHRVDLTGTPDLIAPLAALAPFSRNPTTIRGVKHARFKESDRISVLCQQLARLGIWVEEYPDGLVIYPIQRPPNTTIELDPADDHRMAMAFGLLSLKIPSIVVRDPECVNKSYPQFWEVLERFRGVIAGASGS